MAKCPICKSLLDAAYLEDALPVMNCNSCGGSWIRANEYSFWLKSQKPGSFDEDKGREASERYPVLESNKAVVCPDCGHLLRKYKISAKVDFHLDRCSNCNGIWFDKNEWQSLKLADMHDEINKIFTEPWQQHIQSQESASKFEAMYLQKFGEEDYQRVKDIRAWLQSNPNRNELIAFLLDKNPFST